METEEASNTAQPIICPHPIFVIGAARSGTSILALSLGKHSQLFNLNETTIIDGLFGGRKAVSAYEDSVNRPAPTMFKSCGVTLNEYLKSLGIGINTLFTSKAQGKRWIDKTPRHTLIVDLLAEMFPGACFVHMLRDGRRVVNSMINFHDAPSREEERRKVGPLPQWDFRNASRTWSRYVEMALDFAARHPTRCLTVNHEELIASPAEGFRTIFDFIGAPYEDAPTRYFATHQINSSYQADRRINSPMLSSSSDPWETWTAEQQHIFTEHAGATMARCGLVLPQLTAPIARPVEKPKAKAPPSVEAVTLDVSKLHSCPNPVFIIGSARSGTTILAVALGKHPEFWVSDETFFLHSLFGKNRVELEVARWLSPGPAGSWIRRENVGPAEFLSYLGIGINALFTNRSHGKRWIDHTPRNGLMPETLAGMFPGAFFLHILRDGRDVVHSMLHFTDKLSDQKRKQRDGFLANWAGNFKEACQTWSKTTTTAMEFCENHPHRALVVRYDKLVSDPGEGFGTILHFLEAPPSDAPARYFSSHRINSSFSRIDATGKRVTLPRPDPWESWTGEQKEIFAREAGRTLARYGFIQGQEDLFVSNDA
jgi:protein-tyrosine sulfotransferase